MERDHPEYLAVNGKIILKLILKKWSREAWAGFFWLRIGAGGRAFVIAVRNLCAAETMTSLGPVMRLQGVKMIEN